MASVNKVIIVGNLGGDPEVRYTQGGQIVVNFNVATNERWTNKQTNQPEEKTEWHRIVVWGRLAELCRDYLAKGRAVYLEGRLQTRKWEDKQGQTRYTTEIIAQTVQFLGAPPQGREEKIADTPPRDTSPHPEPEVVATQGGPPPFDAGEDIPF